MHDELPVSKRDKLALGLSERLLQVVDKGAGPITGARGYAESRRALYDDPEVAISRIIKETVSAAGATGFVTGLGGLITLPVAIPAAVTGQAILNARMVGAIAQLRGWDLDDDIVRNMVLVTVAGGQANAILAEFGVAVGKKLAENAIKALPIEVLRAINARVGFMLIAKYGTSRSVVTLAKGVPIVGGVVSGAVDAGYSKTAGTLAKKTFPAVVPSAPTV